MADSGTALTNNCRPKKHRPKLLNRRAGRTGLILFAKVSTRLYWGCSPQHPCFAHDIPSLLRLSTDIDGAGRLYFSLFHSVGVTPFIYSLLSSLCKQFKRAQCVGQFCHCWRARCSAARKIMKVHSQNPLKLLALSTTTSLLARASGTLGLGQLSATFKRTHEKKTIQQTQLFEQ